MRFDRQLLFLAYLFASDRVHGLVIRQDDIGTSHCRHTGSSTWRGASTVISASTETSSANLVLPAAGSFRPDVSPPMDLSYDGGFRHDLRRGARIRRERALGDRADPTPSTSPGLVVPGFRLPSQSGAPVSLVEITTTPPATPTMTTVNALSIFISALPNSAHASLASEASSLVSQYFASSSPIPSSQPSSSRSSASTSQSTSHSSSRSPTSTSHTTIAHTHTQSHNPTTSHTATTPLTSTTSHTTSPTTSVTSQTATSSTASTALIYPTAAHQPTPKPGSDPAHPIPQAAVAGIASSIVAASAIGVLFGFYVWRRKRQGRPLFGPRGSQRSGASDGIYPKSAWLYDPVITPHHGRSRAASEAGSEAEQNLLPNPVRHSRPLSEEIEADLGMPSPSFRMDRASSPLLPVQEIPAITISGDDDGPYGSSPESSPYHGDGGGRRSRPMTFDD